jgi:hypothetical protein
VLPLKIFVQSRFQERLDQEVSLVFLASKVRQVKREIEARKDKKEIQ